MKNNHFKCALIILALFISQQSSSATQDDFIIQVKTDNAGTSANNEFTIQTTGTGYNYNVDCDASNAGTNTATVVTGNYTCIYAVSGTYNIVISDNVGDKTGFPRIFYNHTGDRQKLIRVSQWGTGIWTSMAGAFRGASNLQVNTALAPNLSAVTNLNNMFRFASLANPDTSLWDVSQVTTMHSMFRSASLANPDTSNWDTGNVEIMTDMFRNATSADPDVSGWNIKQVTDMSLMFDNVPLPTASYDSILIAFASQSVKDNVLFNADNSQYCSYLGQQARIRLLSVYNWTIDDIGLCNSTHPINDFVFTIVTNNSGLPSDDTFTIPATGTGYKYNVDCNDDGSFEASGLTGSYTCDYSALGGPGTYTIRIEDANGDGTGFPRIQFGNSNSSEFLEIIELNNWGSGLWDSMESAFENTFVMQILANDGPNLTNVNNASKMFKNAQLASPETALWKTSSIEDMSEMFSGALQANPDTGLWDTQNVSDMSFMFYFDGFGANIAQPDTSGWDTSGVKFMQGMFNQANLADPNTSNWDTQNVSNMSLMFASAVAANPDTSGWFTGGVTDMNAMFAGATSANPDTSGWNTANVTDMSDMFSSATSANPDVSSWDVTNVGDMGNMFNGLTLSVFDYDAILDHFNSQAVQPGIFFTGGNSKYCAVTSHDNLANAATGHGWIINDGGIDASCSDLADDFVIQVDTTIAGSSSNLQFEINTSGAGYNYNIDCDDANTATNTALAQTGNYTCNYAVPGIYTIRIQDNVGDKTGFPRIYSVFHNDVKKITNLKQWGTGLWTSMASAFFSASNMVVSATDNPDLSNLTSLNSMFRSASLANPNTSNWDTTNVTKMSGMFNNASAANPDTNSWVTTNVTDMRSMFNSATSADPDVSQWNVANVEDMGNMFSGATMANPVTSSWVTTSVIDMSYMFEGATLANPDVGGWGVGNVEDMEGMFAGATAAIPITSSWITTSVTDMSYMFEEATAANPDTNNWNTANVTNMHSMFSGATSADPIASNWNIENVTSMTNMFVDVTLTTNNYDAMLANFASQNITQGLNFHAGNSQYCAITAHTILENTNGWMIADAGIAPVCAYGADGFIITVNTANTQVGSSGTTQFTIPISTNVTILGNYNYNVDCDLANIGTNIASGVTTDYTCNYTNPGIYTLLISDNTGLKTGFPAIQTQSNDDNLKIIGLNQWGTGIWSTMTNAFQFAENMVVNAIDVPDLSVVTSIGNMFTHATLANPDVSLWDTSNITFMESVFFNATSANPDVSNWNTGQVTNMSLMFSGATAANPNVSGWITSNVVSMYRMFAGASIAIPNVSTWNTSSVTDMNSMFDGAAMANPDVGGWVTSSVTNMERMFAGASVAIPDVSTWNTSGVTTMKEMFDGATLANPDVSSWITTNVTDMVEMFASASNADPDVSGWDTANVIFMNAMFRFATSADPDLSSWDVENVSNMNVMFLGVALSVQNYDAILANFSSQNLHSFVSFHGGNSTYCNVAAHDILENTFSWSISDAGLDASCPIIDIIFKNSFEEELVFNAATNQFEYDFSKIVIDELSNKPLLIAQGANEVQNIVIKIYLRNDFGQLQIRKDNFDQIEERWEVGQWKSIYNHKLTKISWYK